ncbi:MAG: NAD(P)/FAD-dependent oxidoreductase, partial [Thermoanaerobacteraceae bacterium]|nr:NAD(P)/FAD-dependent oxidoreductase [Thermoanaerobacteraceae bacterium]
CKDGKPHTTIKSFAKESNIYRVVFFKDNIPVGAILCGDTKAATKISKAIKSGVKIPDKIIKSGDFEGFLNEISV